MSDETPTTAAPAAKPTAVELAKTASNYLAGDIAKELADGASGFGKPSIQLLKNHGTYQQDDREQRKAKEGAKSVREISFMIRTCVPGGKLTADQLLAAIDLGDEVGNGTIRLTTRQAIQNHGVVKGDLKPFMQRVHDIQMTTLAACGDVERNIMCCPAPIHNHSIRAQMQAKLDELAELASGGKAWITRYQADEVARTGIPSLKVGFNRVFGFFLEVGRNHASKVPADYIRKQTVKNAERYTTPELDERQRQVLGAEDEALRRELELLEALRQFVAAQRERLDRAANILARIDVLVSLAEVARSRGWVRPEISSDGVLAIEAGRHPVLEEILPAGTLVANDLFLAARLQASPGSVGFASMLLVTGPNMGGKSTFIRQAALLVVMAQAGSFVPARRARIGVVDRLFARIGAGDDLATGASTFLVEMAQTARILNRSTPRSLVILDEVGRGTSTFDGLAIAQAVVEWLHGVPGCRTLFATHYLQLAALDKLPGVANVQVLVKQHNDQLVFLHQVAPGAADKSWGVHVARLAGVPAAVVERARDLLLAFESSAAPPAAKPRRKGETAQKSLFD